MRAKATKATAAQNMARRAERLLAGIEGERAHDRVAKLRFPSPAPCGRTPLTAEGLSRSYGSLEVFTDVDLAIDRGSRVVVLGLNGAGKTTLLRILAGVDAPDTGEVLPGHGLKLGYYAQEHENLDVERTVLENMKTAAPDLGETEVRKVLGSFLFTGDDVDKPAKVLSGGEKTRLSLAMLVVSAANVLLLDEPTNNLDPGESPIEGVIRETLEESGARVTIDAPFAIISIAHINQVHLFYRWRLISPDYCAGEESLEVALLSPEEIPWQDLAFRSVSLCLERYLADRARGDFAFHETERRPPKHAVVNHPADSESAS